MIDPVPNDSVLYFPPSSARLIQQLNEVHPHILSKADIASDVMYDEEAAEGSIRTLVYTTRKILKTNDIPIDILTINRKGYQLIELPY